MLFGATLRDSSMRARLIKNELSPTDIVLYRTNRSFLHVFYRTTLFMEGKKALETQNSAAKTMMGALPVEGSQSPRIRMVIKAPMTIMTLKCPALLAIALGPVHPTRLQMCQLNIIITQAGSWPDPRATLHSSLNLIVHDDLYSAPSVFACS